MKRGLILILLCAACAGTGKSSSAVFRAPARYVGQDVTVCGYFERGGMVYPTEATHSLAGIGLIDHGNLLRGYVGWGCIKGRMVYRGCGRTRVCVGNGTVHMIDLTGGEWVERANAQD